MESEFRLTLTVRPPRSVLQRCLQIASRRGFVLVGLRTFKGRETSRLECAFYGPDRWQEALIHLLTRSADVLTVTKETNDA